MTVGLEHPDPNVEPAGIQTGDEWLLTNGVGGFAMGTESGIHTRRYHGFLVAAASPPVLRIVAWHSVADEIRFANGQTWRFPSHDFEGAAATPAVNLIDLIRTTESVTWCFEIPDRVLVERSLRVEPGTNRVTLTYRLPFFEGDATVVVRPFVPLRDFHALTHDGESCPQLDERGHGMIALRRDALIMTMTPDAAAVRWTPEPTWWHDFVYRADRERGQDWREDLWTPGVFELDVSPTQPEASIDAELTGPTRIDEREAVNELASIVRSPAARDFIVRRGHGDGAGWSILAGYPWFADWGRDTMIALPGLLLRDGAVDQSWTVLRTFAARGRRGLIPNRFDDHGGEPHYNTVDASLWFVHAVWRTARADASGAPADLVETCRAICTAYRDGTDHGIHMDSDGLIVAGDATTQLTWMDAKRNDVVFTPRHGKAVEINALWYHALCCMADLEDATSDTWTTLASQVAESFRESFWWDARQALHDVLVPHETPGVRRATTTRYEPDGCFRPNQIFAVSLPHTALTDAQCVSVVAAVRSTLLTPMGLRTLEPDHALYRGRFEGDMMSRDAAYHNGTVWPWLIGPFVDAVRRVASSDPESDIRAILRPLCERLDRTGTLPEICDGDAPHTPAGCPAQAWSVAEVLRVCSPTTD